MTTANEFKVLVNDREYTVSRVPGLDKEVFSISCIVEVACGKWNETRAEKLVFIRQDGRLGRKILKAFRSKVQV